MTSEDDDDSAQFLAEAGGWRPHPVSQIRRHVYGEQIKDGSSVSLSVLIPEMKFNLISIIVA